MCCTRRLRRIGAATIIVIGASIGASAKASLLLDIERLSATDAILTATGTIGSVSPAIPDGNPHILAVENPFLIAPPANQNSGILGSPNTLQVGSESINFAFDVASNFKFFSNTDPGLYFGNFSGVPFVPGSALTGELELSLNPDTSFATIGTTGNVWWGGTLGEGVIIGTWDIVGPQSVPEPASLFLLAGALAGLGVARRRRFTRTAPT